jgi:soluble lytic murein transglycosylase-like protein
MPEASSTAPNVVVPMATTAPSRWTRWLRRAAHGVAASALLAGGVMYTLTQTHPTWHQPNTLTTPAEASPAPLGEAGRVASVLRHYTPDVQAANRIADAIVDEGHRRNLDPALLVGVLLTEDQTLDTMARSNVGARGLMQVMPFHSGKWGCGSSNLFGIESNICHGASVLEDAVRSAPNMRTALLRYNGCVHGTNTRNCHSYPDKVIRVANRATAQMLALN